MCDVESTVHSGNPDLKVRVPRYHSTIDRGVPIQDASGHMCMSQVARWCWRRLRAAWSACRGAERPRCPPAWLADSRTTFRTSIAISTTGGGGAASHPLVPHTFAAAPGEVARFGLVGVGQLARLARKHCSRPQWLGLSREIFA